MKRKNVIVTGFNSHDCEVRYKCPYCSNYFGSWDVCNQNINKNGTKYYCPNCKKN